MFFLTSDISQFMNRKIYLFYAFQVIAFFLAFNMNAQNVISIGGPTSVCVGETKTYSTSGYGSVTWSVTGGGVIKGSNVGVFVSVQWNGNGTLNADYCYWIDPPEECHDGQVPCEPDVQPPCYGQICDDPPPYSVCDHGDLSVITNAYPPVPAITGLLSKAIPGATILTASNGTSYQWLRDGVAIPGATYTQFMSVASGTYKVRSTNVTTGCATESTETIVNGNDKNFSVSNNLLIPGITTEAQLHAQQLNNGSNLGYVNQSVSYADDLGKPIESVQVQSSPARKDIIGFKDFDALGREAKKWLPYTSGQASGMFVSVSTAISNQSTFFNGLNDKIADDTSPFATTAFENSPLSSAIGQKGVGNYWQSNNIGTAASYGSNSETTVLNWSMNGIAGSPIASSPTYYTASALTKALGIDENSIHSETYTDLQGRKILLRTDLGGGVWAETYYVYNRKNNLTFMLPPQLVKLLKDANSFAPTQAQLDTWAYQYKYDNLGRQIESKAPGAGWVYTIYDQRDRILLTQDGNQRTNNEWSYTKYDDLNRPVISGIYKAGASVSRTDMQLTVDALSSGLGYQNLDPQARVVSGVKVGLDVIVNGYENVNEYKAVNSIILKPGFTFTAGTTATAFRASIDDGSATATSADVFPTTNDEALVISYYDGYTHCGICQDANYQFVTESGWNGPCNEPFQSFNRIKGQTVASSVKILGSQTSWLNTVTYYNRWGQVIQTIGSNHLGGLDRVSSLVDFSGKTLEQLQTAIGYNSGGVNTLRKRYSYDHTGRVINTYHKINSQTEVILSSLEYNELGQMVRKKLHSVDGSTFLQNLDYRYNIRGWLTNKNNIPSTGDVGDDANDYFGMDLNYNNTIAGAGNTPRTDGMISALKYKHDLSDKKRLYNFSYDNLGRLINAAHKMSPNNGATWGNETDFFNEAANYDQNGNITNLSRNAETFDRTSYIADPVDNLAYNYGSGGNQLQFVQDNSSSTNNKNLGFKDGGTNTAGDPDYAYDANGNVTKDQNKGITNITYYSNNLPSRVTFSDGSYLQNTYDAAGIKLKSYYYKAAIGATPEVAITTDYVGSMVLLNGEVLTINHEEGRITAPTYSNLMDNREAGSTSGFAASGNVTLGTAYQNTQTYVTAVCNQATGTPGVYPIATSKGTNYTVKAGENYSFKVLGYQSVGATASLYVTSNAGNIVWAGATLPQGAANENWVTATFTIPSGVTSISVGVLWNGPANGNTIYINRVALYKTDFEYNYFITDQVGSPRVVLQTNPATITYTATMEPKNQSTEGSQFLNMTATSLVASPGNTTSGGNTVVSLNMSNKVGPAKILKVYPGDVISASAYSYYITQGGYTAGTSSGVGAAVAQAFGGTLNALGDPGAIYKNVTEAYNGGIGGLLFDRGNSTYPSAYINYILFDKDYKPLGGQSVPISTTPNTPQPLVLSTITANEIGYVYIYLSYDNASGGDVFFDDFKITVTESPVIQVNSYYPFGLQAYTWLRAGETDNAYLFQGKELIAQTGWHDFGSRMYWADLGRWFSGDPAKQFASGYVGMGNNPVMMVDPDGEFAFLIVMAAGAVFNLATNWDAATKDFGSFVKYAGIGAVGGLAASTGNFALAGAIVGGGNTWAQGGNAEQIMMGAGIGAISGAIGGAAGGAVGKGLGGFAQGFVQGAVGGAAGGFTGGFLLGTYQTGDIGLGFQAGIKGGVVGGITGGVAGGLMSIINTRIHNSKNPDARINYINGQLVAEGRSPWSFNNTPRGTATGGDLITLEFGENPRIKMDYDAVYADIREHGFSRNHLKDGLGNLGSKDFISLDAVSQIERALPMLREGNNMIITRMNGKVVTIRANVHNGVVRSGNIFVGTQTRNGGNFIYLSPY
jgi:RHS repeat-associated protein